MRLLEQGNTVRRVAATNMNEQSSRSHSCFTIKIQKKTITELDGGITREQLLSARINLVDLAGKVKLLMLRYVCRAYSYVTFTFRL